jgi:hypothetical protein
MFNFLVKRRLLAALGAALRTVGTFRGGARGFPSCAIAFKENKFAAPGSGAGTKPAGKKSCPN